MKQVSGNRYSAFRATSRLGMTSLLLIILISAIARPATAATIYVNAAATGVNNGSSWTDAFKTISSAITAAASGDQIWVAKGTYVEKITLKAETALYGGFAGSETELSQRNWTTNVTILDGNQAGNVVTSPSGATTATRIDGFTIRNGSNYGIYCSSSSLTITNNTVKANSTGGIYYSASNYATIINNIVTENGGVGIRSSSTPLVITNNTITGNSSSGISASYNSLTITNNIISGNTTTSGGGGIRCYHISSSTVISNNTILKNATTSYGGGGIYCGQCSPMITNNTIRDNSAHQGGGVYCDASSSPMIMNNMILGNYASEGGGVYCISNSTPTIANNTIIANWAYYGSGIFSGSSSLNITNNTIVGNVTGTITYGVTYGVIFCSQSSPAITNNIVAYNSSGIYKSGSTGTPVLRHNNVYGNTDYNYSGLAAGSGAISADPMFVALEYGQFHIRADSPCIDAGYDSAINTTWVDMDGESRKQGSHVDIGVDEYNGSPPVYTPRIFRVSPLGNDENDGSSWTLAKRTVQAGIDAASVNGGDVWVAAGTYNERISLNDYIYLYGGFAGTEEFRSQRNRVANTTILDGGAGGSVVTISSHGNQISAIDGFTIRNGTGTTGLVQSGGGINCRGGSPIISNNTITANSTPSGSGGGINCNGYAPFIDNNVITNNSAKDGGGIYCSGDFPVIRNNIISANTATIGTGFGGGIYCYSSNPMIQDNTITGNTANRSGGIYVNYSSSPTISNNSITDNKAYSTGGIFCENNSPAKIVNNNIARNSAMSYGGGITCDTSSVTIANNTIQHNIVTGSTGMGGGIYCVVDAGATDSVTVAGNTLVGNSASAGGAIYCPDTNTSIAYSIIAFNSSGIYATGTATLRSNCAYGNVAYNYSGVTNPTGTYGNISADPLFMRTPGIGADNKWGTTDDVYGDLIVKVVSPCIDAGDNAAVPAGILSDMHDNPRFIDATYKADTGSGTAPIVDIGHHEAGPSLLTLFVKADATGASTGLTWTDAYTKLSDAMNVAALKSEVFRIWVAAGTYKPAAFNGSRPDTFRLRSELAIYGGFAGNEDPATFNLADRNFTANPTILSGDLNGNDGPNFSNNAENSYHVVTVSGLDDTAILDGFTIQGGNANGAAPHDRGAGIYNDNGKPKLSNCILTGNAASTAGAALSNNGSLHMSLSNCQFISNASSKYGGAITNTAGFYTDAVNCTFIGNTAPTYGGAISNFIPRATAGNATLRNCTFYGNTSSSGNGGAIYGNIDLMTNCVFSGNTAVNGGAFNGLSNMINCTFSRNTATTTGGGIYYTVGAQKLSNCILWNNSDSSGMTKNAQIYGDKPTVNYSVVQNWTVGVTGRGNTSTDPLFVDADGPDNIIGTADDDLHLQAGSPCIDTGAALARAYYQTGTTRSDNTLDTGIVDMGFHYDATLAFDADGDLDSADFVAFSACYDGPVNFVEPDCYQADFNNDHYVDAVDFDFFSACYNGPTNLPGCR